MDLIIEIAVVLAVSGILSAAAYVLRMLTLGGSIASFITGTIVGVFGGLDWFILLMIFTIAGFAATKIGFSKKKAKGLQEGRHGERTHMNILGVGIAPCVFAVISYFVGDDQQLLVSIGFIGSISVAAADTLASELGVKDQRVWMCTTLKRVPPGTDGGMSLFGTGIALAGAFVTSILGWLVLYQTLDWLLIIPAVSGFIGCYVDSVFGATIETRGWISKYTNNALTGIIGGLVAMGIGYFFV